MFDLTCRPSFESLDKLLFKYLAACHRPSADLTAVVLVGSKKDLTSRREISEEEVRSWCRQKRPHLPIPYLGQVFSATVFGLFDCEYYRVLVGGRKRCERGVRELRSRCAGLRGCGGSGDERAAQGAGRWRRR